MLFHSWEFAVFFPVVYCGHLLLRRSRWATGWLLLASYVFYARWNVLYLLLIGYSTAVDFFVVRAMERSRRRRGWLWVSVCSNLAVLGFFKYAGFVTDNVNALLTSLGMSLTVPAPGILLPVGISFYTFQSMSYTLDFYRGRVARENSLVRYATFVALFPQLVAGPIERARNLLVQLRENRAITAKRVADGLSLFTVGLFKKVAVADYLGRYVDRVYAMPGEQNASALLLATFAFGWQIYCDFSGYTDMARGVARMMGFDLMLNFNSPYLATGLGDFWRRWHISLSSWFRDYLYIPLGGNRRGRILTYRNMLVTMAIAGVWHGAAWTFLAWGALHALGRIVTRELEATRLYRERIPRFVKQVLVFTFVTFAWIFFRAQGIDEAAAIVNGIFTAGFGDPRFPLLGLWLILGIWGFQFLAESRWRRLVQSAPVRVGGLVLMIVYLLTASGYESEAFIYFQF